MGTVTLQLAWAFSCVAWRRKNKASTTQETTQPAINNCSRRPLQHAVRCLQSVWFVAIAFKKLSTPWFRPFTRFFFLLLICI